VAARDHRQSHPNGRKWGSFARLLHHCLCYGNLVIIVLLPTWSIQHLFRVSIPLPMEGCYILVQVQVDFQETMALQTHPMLAFLHSHIVTRIHRPHSGLIWCSQVPKSSIGGNFSWIILYVLWDLQCGQCQCSRGLEGRVGRTLEDQHPGASKYDKDGELLSCVTSFFTLSYTCFYKVIEEELCWRNETLKHIH